MEKKDNASNYKKKFNNNKVNANTIEKDIKITVDENGSIYAWAVSGLKNNSQGFSRVVCLNNGYFSPIVRTKVEEDSIQHLVKIGSGFLVIESSVTNVGMKCKIYEVKYYDKIKKIAHLKLKDSYNGTKKYPAWSNGKYLVKCKKQIHSSMNKAKEYYSKKV